MVGLKAHLGEEAGICYGMGLLVGTERKRGEQERDKGQRQGGWELRERIHAEVKDGVS